MLSAPSKFPPVSPPWFQPRPGRLLPFLLPCSIWSQVNTHWLRKYSPKLGLLNMKSKLRKK
uniref:Uncharacterized protein n=1 Tax=Anguilla anguilla TaxID=7936 RepID=A0A0E9VCJ7_ANGAN